ncbi:MAG: NAD-dependent epimerase/dehydratase family protein [Ignavibacteriaceae bacterium]
MKILVTGGAGFIGSQVADAFIADGHDVSIIDNLSTGNEKNINSKAHFFKNDIGHPDIIKIFEREKFDVVNHHAAQIDVRKSVNDPIFDANVNILGTINLLQCCIKTRVRNFMFASTGGAVYGEQEYFPADENHPTNPVSPYGITKLTIEKYLFFYKNEYGLNYKILRYGNVYGPRQNPLGEAGVVSIFINKLLRNENPFINGYGKQTRDYVFVEDVVKANLLNLNNESSDTYNIGTGIETNVNELFTKLNIISGERAKEKHGPPAKGEQLRSVITSDKLFNKFNWKPSVKIDKGLKITYDYFKSNK